MNQPAPLKTAARLHIDDAGHDEISLQALQALVEAGRVESLSVMATMPATHAFAAFWHSLPAGSRPVLFLHFNIVEGKPLTNMPTITRRDGSYAGMPAVVRAALQGTLRRRDVRRELEAQMQVMHKLELPVIGIDSHMHMHALASVAEVVDGYARAEGLCIRDFTHFRTVTIKGACKLWLLAQIARMTQFRLDSRLALPVSWKSQKPWKPFVMCSWEAVGTHNAPAGSLIACHPKIGCDVYEVV